MKFAIAPRQSVGFFLWSSRASLWLPLDSRFRGNDERTERPAEARLKAYPPYPLILDP